MEIINGVVGCNLPAVVLAGGSCNGLMPITSTIPKALIKVGNRTLLSYTLENLQRSGIKDIHIVSSNEHVDAIGEHVKMELATNLRIVDHAPPNVVTYGLVADSDGFFGSTDALRYMATYIKGSFVLVPCDLYGFFDLSKLINDHLSTKRLCTVALVSDPTLSSKQDGKTSLTLHDHNIAIGGHSIRNFNYKYQIIATLDCDNDQLVEWANIMTVDSGDPYVLSKWKSYQHPRCRIQMDLVDLHIYVFSEQVFDVISNSAFQHTSIRLDLIPYLIKNVETLRPAEAIESMTNGDTGQQINQDVHDQNFESFNEDDRFRVFGSAALGAYSLVRVSTLESFLYANLLRCATSSNRVVPSSCNGNKVKDVIVGSNCLFLGRAIVRHSVIGDNASIGSGCRITNSVIMDDAVIEEGTVLDGSIIGKSSAIGANANLSRVVVAPGYRVQSNMHLENDFLPPFIVN